MTHISSVTLRNFLALLIKAVILLSLFCWGMYRVQPPLLSQRSVFSTPLRGIHADKLIKGSVTQRYLTCLKMLPECSNFEGLSWTLGIQSTCKDTLKSQCTLSYLSIARCFCHRCQYLHSSSFAILFTRMRKASVNIYIFSTQILEILWCSNFFLLLIFATRVKQVKYLCWSQTGHWLLHHF